MKNYRENIFLGFERENLDGIWQKKIFSEVSQMMKKKKFFLEISPEKIFTKILKKNFLNSFLSRKEEKIFFK